MVQKIISGGKTKAKGSANVCFLLDVTGSMQDCLENLKDNLIQLSSKVDEISKQEYKVAAPDVTYNAIGYRDLTTEEPDDYRVVTRGPDFVSDLGKIRTFFDDKKMQADGGGDNPESTLDAIVYAARNLNWEKPARVLVVFTDAETHQRLHPSMTSGVQFDEEESMMKVMEEVTSRKLRVVIFGISGVSEYKRIGSLDNCMYVEMEKGAESLKEFEDMSLFKEKVIAPIAASISKSSSQAVVFNS